MLDPTSFSGLLAEYGRAIGWSITAVAFPHQLSALGSVAASCSTTVSRLYFTRQFPSCGVSTPRCARSPS